MLIELLLQLYDCDPEALRKLPEILSDPCMPMPIARYDIHGIQRPLDVKLWDHKDHMTAIAYGNAPHYYRVLLSSDSGTRTVIFHCVRELVGDCVTLGKKKYRDAWVDRLGAKRWAETYLELDCERPRHLCNIEKGDVHDADTQPAKE